MALKQSCCEHRPMRSLEREPARSLAAVRFPDRSRVSLARRISLRVPLIFTRFSLVSRFLTPRFTPTTRRRNAVTRTSRKSSGDPNCDLFWDCAWTRVRALEIQGKMGRNLESAYRQPKEKLSPARSFILRTARRKNRNALAAGRHISSVASKAIRSAALEPPGRRPLGP